MINTVIKIKKADPLYPLIVPVVFFFFTIFTDCESALRERARARVNSLSDTRLLSPAAVTAP